jgi:hypothetical protein
LKLMADLADYYYALPVLSNSLYGALQRSPGCYNKLWNSSRHRILKLCRNKGILKEGRDCL